jgi:gliding motility-associated-like protein
MNTTFLNKRQIFSVLQGIFTLLFTQYSFAQSLNLGDDEIICSGSNTVSLSASTSNLSGLTVSSYAWTIDGVNASSSTNSLTVSASLNPNNPQLIVCTATLSDNSTISDNLLVYTINPGIIAGDQFSCSSPFNPSTFTSVDSGTTSLSGVNNFNDSYQWESAPTANGPWTVINGQTGSTYNPTNISVSTYFRRVLEVTIGNINPISGSCASNTIFVQVLNTPTISANQCIASGATANMSVSFSPALPSGYTATYSWSGPNSFTSSSASASVTSFGTTKVGTYTCNITVSNGSNSCSYSPTTQLNIKPITPSFSLLANGCPGTNYSPTNFSPQAGTTYDWNVNPSSASTGLNTNSPTFNFNTGGTYTVSLTASILGCSLPPVSQTINILNLVNVLPEVDGAQPMTVINGVNTFAICSGASTSNALVFNNNSTNPANTTYSYTINGGSVNNFSTSATVPINYGNNTFVYTATSGGCSVPGTINIYSGSNPYVSLGANNSISLCPGSIVNFVIDPTQSPGVTNPPGTTYSLFFSDATGFLSFSNLINDEVVSHTYNTTSCGVPNSGTTFPANTFYSVVTAQNPCGTTQSYYSPITVHNLPTANFTISDSTICTNQTVNVLNTGNAGSIVGISSPYNCSTQGKFYWTITGGALGVNYTLGSGQTLGFNCSPPNCSWGSTASNGSSTLNINFLTAGYYTISQIYYNSCGSKTFTRNICVINPPTCQFTATPSSGCTPLTVAINNTTIAPTCSGTPVPLTYAWTVTSPSGTSSSYTTSTAQAPANLILTNPTSSPQTFTISLTVSPKDPYNSSQNFGNPNCTSTCTQTVTVYPKPIYTPVNITTCNDPYQVNVNLQTTTNIANCSFAWSATSNTNVIGESTSNQTTSLISDNLDNTTSNFQTVTYTVTPTTNLGCVGNTGSFTVTLNYVDPGSIASDQTICNGGDPANIVGTLPNGSGTISYIWQSSNNNTTWTNISGATSQSYNPPGPINTDTYYKRVVTFTSNGVSCSGTSNVILISVNTINPGTISAAQNLCTGDDPAALNIVTSATGTGTISYIWQQSNSATGPWTSISGQTGATYDPPVLGSTTYYSILATSVYNTFSCSANTPAVAVIVYTLSPGTISGTQSICSGGNPTTFSNTAASSNATAVSYQWQISTDNINWTDISGATSATFDPPALTLTTYYRRKVNVLVGSTIICQGVTSAITVTVIPDPTVSSPTGQTICTGGSPAPLTVTPSGGISSSYSYQWYNGATLISGATASSYTPSAVNGTYYCQININPAAATGCSVNSSTAQITVIADPVVSAPLSATYCQDAGSVVALSITASGGLSTAYNYQWYINTVNNNTGGTPISGETSSTFTPSVNIVGIKYYYCLVTISPSSTGCSTASAVAAITVTAGPSITSHPLNQTKCIGGTFSSLTVASTGGTGSPTYQWYSNTVNSNNGGTLINGATAATYPLPSNLSSTAGINYYYCVISYSASGGCSVISSNAATITVLAPPTVNAITNKVYCKNTLAPATALTGNYSSGMSYVWSVNNSSLGLSPTSGTSSTIPSFTTINNGTAPITGTVTITPSYTTGSLTCPGSPSGIFTITVNPTPTMSQFNPLLFVFCENATGTVPFSANISSGMTYSWTNDNTQIGLGATGISTSPGLSFTAVNNASPNQPLTSNFMVTPIYTNGAVSCPGTAVPFAITVNPLPDVIPLPDYTICATSTGSNQFSSLNPIVGLGTTYVWANSNPAIGMGASGNGSHFFTATNTTLTPITGNVTVTPTYTNNGVSCLGPIDNFVITVNPMPTINAIANEGLCVGESTTAVTPSGNIPGTLYTWSNNNISTGLGAGGTGLIPSFIGLNTTNAPNVSTINVVPSYSFNNITCTGTAGQFGININPTPNVNPIANKQVCAEISTSVQFSSTPIITGTIYSWTNNNTAIGLAASGTGAISFNATNTTSSPITSTITVTPSFTNAGSTCYGPPESFDIVVLPTPVMTPINNQTICSGDASSLITFGSNLTGTLYDWTNSNTTIGLGASGTGISIPSFTTINNGNQQSQGIITISPSLTTNNQTCLGTPLSVFISVNPIPALNPITNPSFCHGSPASVALSSTVNTGMTYAWTNTNTTIGLGASGNGSISFTAQNNSSNAINGLISVIPTYTNNNVQCTGQTSSFTINVGPNPVVNPIVNQVFCNNSSTTPIQITSTVLGTNLAWTNANNSIGLGSSGIGTIPVFTTVNPSSTSVATSLVTVTPTLAFNGLTCPGPIINFPITINPTPIINTIPNTTLCTGQTSLAINFSGTGTAYTWSNNNSTVGIGLLGNTNIPPFTATNSGTTINSSTITVTSQFTSNGLTCYGNNTAFTISVLPTPSVIAPPNSLLCSGSLYNSVLLTGVGTNYNWSNNQTSIGLSNAGSGLIPSFVTTNTGANTVVSTISISPSYVLGSKTCTGSTQSYTITVIPSPNITSQPQSQTICIGGTLNTLSVAYSGGSGTPTYQWFSSTTNSNTNGTPISGATNSTYSIPSATLIGTNYYYCVLTFLNSGTCSVITSNPAAITIINSPTILTPPLATQSVCVGGTAAPLTVVINGGSGTPSYQWYTVSGINYTPISGQTAVSYTPPSYSTAGTYNYAVLVNQSASGCATTYSPIAVVNVVPDPSVTNPVSASYCLNSSTVVALSVVASGGVSSSAYNYQWYSTNLNNNTTGNPILGANTSSYIPPATATGIIYYYCVVSQGLGCSVNSAQAIITITSSPTINTQPISSQTVCVGGTLTNLSVNFSGGSGVPTYQWYSNSVNSTIGGVAIGGAINQNYTPSTSLAGTNYYYCVITFNISGCSSITSNLAQVTVVPDPVVTTQPLITQSICSGGSIPVALNTAYSGGTGSVSYQWFSIDGGTNTLISGATLSSYTPPVFSTAGTYNFAVQISLSGSGCGMVQSNNAQVIVLTDPIVSAPISATYCNGYSPVQALSVSSTGGLSGTTTYQWYRNTLNSNTGGTLISGATLPTYTPSVTVNGLVYYYCVISQGAANTGCTITSPTALITTTTPPSFNSHPSLLQTACVGGTINNLSVSYIGGSTNPSYQWYSNSTNSNVGGTPIPGANATNYLPPNNLAGTRYYYCVINFPTISCTSISSNPGGVIIHPDPIISVQPLANQAICFGTTLSAPLNISYTGGYGTASYQWNLINGSNTSPIITATNSSYLPSNFNVADTFIYNVTLNLTGNGCNAQTSNLANVIVMPIPVVDSVGSYLYCNADSSTMVVFSSPITGTTYVWANDNTGIGLGASGFGNIVPFEVTNMNTFGISSNITVTPQLTSFNTTCSGTPIDFSIMVNPYQDVQNPGNFILCHGTGVNGIQFFGSALINNWTNDLPALGVGSSGTGTIPAFLAVNNGTQPIVANLSVTPSFSAVTTCPGDIETFTITILPAPNASITPINQLVCSGALSSTINMSGTATSFSWTNNQPSIGLAANGTGNIPAFLTTATGSNTTSTVSVTPIYTLDTVSCPGTSQNVQITVVPAPSTLPLQDLVLCNGEATGLIPILGNANVLNWSSSIPSIGTGSTGTGSIPSFNVVNSGQNPISSVISVTPINLFGGLSCMGQSGNFSITVNPSPSINTITDKILCAETNSPLLIFSGNANGYSWTNSNTSIGLGSSGTGNIGSFLTQNNLSSLISANINVIPSFTNAGITCQGTPETFIIDVLPKPFVNSINPQVLCNGDLTAPITFNGNATSYSWFNNNTSIGLVATGSGNINSFNVNAGATNNVANIVVTPSYIYNTTTCFGTPITTTITALPSPFINNVQDLVVCNGTLSGTLAFSGAANNINWTNSNPSIGLPANGNGNLPPFNYTNTSSNPIQATIMVTPQTGLGAQTCQGTSEIFTITVNPSPTMVQPNNQVLCSQTQSSPVNFSTLGNASNYSWTNSNTSIGLPSFGTSSIPAFIGQNINPADAIAQIQVVPLYTNAGTTCPGDTSVFTYTVKAIPVLQYSLSQGVCSGDTSAVVSFSSPMNGVNFNWNISNISGPVSGINSMNGTGNIPSMILSSNTVGQFNYQASANYTPPINGCTGIGQIGTITVNPVPIMQPLNDLTICNNELINYNLSASTSILSSFNWSTDLNTNIVGQPSGVVNSNVIFNALQNNSSTIQSLTYTVTPTSFPLGCIGNSQDFTVQVIPTIILDTLITPLFDSICSGEITNVQLQTNYPANIVWHAINNPNVSGETTTSTTGNYISDLLVNNTPFNQYVTYYVEKESIPNLCQGIPEIITIKVFPAIQLTNASNINLCSNDTLSINLAATVNATFTWNATNNGVVQGESTVIQNTGLINDVLVNNSTMTEQVYYSIDIQAVNSNCYLNDLPLTVNVLPLPLLLNVDTAICSSENTSINLATNIPSTIIWNGVFNLGIQGETTANISGNFINDYLVNNSGQDVTLIYEIQAIANGCPAPLDSILVIVHDQPDVDFVVSANPYCTDSQIQFTNLSSNLYDFDWSFGDGGTSTSFSPSYIYSNSGIYNVELIGTDLLTNCSTKDSINLTINLSPDASFYSMDTVGCGDLNSTFFANYQATSDMVWDFGDGQTLTQVGNVTNYYGQAGCYDISLTVTSPEGCVAQETYDDYICVYEYPIAMIGASPMSVNALDATIQFSNNSQNAISYLWQMGDGSISYDDNPTYTYPTVGADYNVIMTAYNEVGCSDTASISINVFEDLIYYLPNTFTPNDDEKNQVFLPILSQGMKKDFIEFYIYNRWGELVFESRDPKYGWDGTYSQGVLDCTPGTYSWKLKLETLQTQEIVEFYGHVNLIR